MIGRSRRTFTLLLVLASFGLLVLAGGFHHHDDGLPHPDCFTCAVAHQSVVASEPVSALLVSASAEEGRPRQAPLFVSLKEKLPAPVRAPPYTAVQQRLL